MSGRSLAAVLALGLLPGCGWLFASVRNAVSSSGGPLVEGAHVTGDTSFSGPHRTMSCGSAGDSPQAVHVFVAPRNALYTIDSHTTDFDGALAVFSAGSEIACNDDSNGTRQSQLVVALTAGQSVEVVQGGYQGNAGRYDLVVVGAPAVGAAVPAGTAIVLHQPMPLAGGATDAQPDVCGLPPGSVDRSFTFSPPSDGFYSVYADTDALLVIGDAQHTITCAPLSPERRTGVTLKSRHRYSFVFELGTQPQSAQAHYVIVERTTPTATDWAIPPHPSSPTPHT